MGTGRTGGELGGVHTPMALSRRGGRQKDTRDRTGLNPCDDLAPRQITGTCGAWGQHHKMQKLLVEGWREGDRPWDDNHCQRVRPPLTPIFSSDFASTSQPFFWLTKMIMGGSKPCSRMANSFFLLGGGESG